MNHKIYLLIDEFKQQISKCENQESYIIDMADEYKKDISNLCDNNQGQIAEIRLHQIKEISAELEKSMLELDSLKKQKEAVLYAYCDKKGHTNILIASQFLGDTGRHSFRRGFQIKTKNTYKCLVCGTIKTHIGESYSNAITEGYERKMPDDIYDDDSLMEDGKTIRMILSEIEQIRNYISYLKLLQKKLCELFGHEIYSSYAYSIHECKCCDENILSEEYYDFLRNAKYKGLVPYGPSTTFVDPCPPKVLRKINITWLD